MLILTIGDIHIPERAIGLPRKFVELLNPRGKIDTVLCLGNVATSPSTTEFLQSLSNDYHCVQGQFDQDGHLPQSLVFTFDGLKVGIINGYQIIPQNDPLSLLQHARMMDVDVLVYGSTHKVEAYTLDGKFFVNPGSATGAFSTERIEHEDVAIINQILKKTTLNEKDTEEVKRKKEEHELEDGGKEEKEDKAEVEKKEQAEEQVEETLLDNNSVEEDGDEEIDEYLSTLPSFCLLDIKGLVCTLYFYTLIEGEVKIDKLTYRKD